MANQGSERGKHLQDQLKTLSNLQAVDLRIQQIKRDSEQFPVQIEELKKGAEDEKQKLEQKEAKLKQLNTQRRDLERELEDMERKVVHEKDKLMSVKTNKEYHAVLKEIDSLKLESEEREYRILTLMEEIEEYEKEVARSRDRYNEFDKKSQEAIGKLSGSVEGFELGLSEQEIIRTELASGLEVELMKRYMVIQIHHPGSAVAKVSRGVCMGCNTRIPPQLYNMIIANEDI